MESELHEINQLKSIRKNSGPEQKDSEYWEFLLMLGFGNPRKTEQLYKTLRDEIPRQDWRMPLVEIGEARILSLSSRDLDCHKRLQSASEIIFSRSNFLNEQIQSEILALYYYVLTLHHERILHQSSPLPMLFMGKNLTTIDTFQLAFSYRIAVNEVKWLKAPISNVVSMVKKLERSGLWTLACIGYRSMAILSRRRGDISSAYKYYEAAFGIASRMHLRISQKQLQNANAYALFSDKRLNEAEQEYLKITLEGEHDPIIPVLYENLALLAEAREDYALSISHIKRAISVSTQLDSIPNIPGEYLFLGRTYENHFDDIEQAEHYYRLGYDHAMRYASHGISLTGERKAVVDAYVNIINKRRGSKTHKPVDRFSFSQGKPWKDIKDIFHHQLICYHHKIQQNSKAMATKLNMPASTLYSLQDRLKKRGYQLPEKASSNLNENHSLFTFIEEHEEMTWDAINSIFEREIIHYLYEKYGYNKQRMAQILKLSYPSIITKTRELTQVSEHLLPN
jgi:tetratricopeptide (TPR) repeat protein